MLYTTFHDLQLSRLGMGAMRLPNLGERRGPIDEPAARAVIEAAYAGGVNYFDTAYRYHGGASEPFLARVLSQYPRDSYYLATKLPGHQMTYRNGELAFTGYLSGEPVQSPATIFEDQLARCGVEYFDFYLLHNVAESSLPLYSDPQLAVVDLLLEEKRRGRIRHLGCSSHGRLETLQQFLDRFDGVFEFVQLQLNYLDWIVQNARARYDLLTARGIPVWVMEPVRGGRLAAPGTQAEALLRAARPEASYASWALRWLKTLPNVGVVLSGMTTLEQVEDNLRTMSTVEPWTSADQATIDAVVAAMADTVPCTACRYCTELCPQELDIPRLIALYNELAFEPRADLSAVLAQLDPEDLPSNCIACRSCVSACPQGIEIPDVLARLAERMAAL
ncbi:MAG: aldo/keto reductase [Anaerolineae bacterium]|jgi:predicted aldo/keto reductase-like oxidoreductase|nr:oxidoreductase [Chloroflexota bacterium]